MANINDLLFLILCPLKGKSKARKFLVKRQVKPALSGHKESDHEVNKPFPEENKWGVTENDEVRCFAHVHIIIITLSSVSFCFIDLINLKADETGSPL